MASIHLPQLYDERGDSGGGGSDANGQLRPTAVIDALIDQEGYAFLDRYMRACRHPRLAAVADGRSVAHRPAQPAPLAVLESYADLYQQACDHWTHWLPAEGEVIKACIEVVRKRRAAKQQTGTVAVPSSHAASAAMVAPGIHRVGPPGGSVA